MASCQRKQRAALARNARAREQTRENAEGLASVLDLVDQTRRRRLGSFAGNIKPNLGKIGFCRGANGAQSGHRQGIGRCRRRPRQRLRRGSDHRPREEAVSRPLTHRLTDTIASMTASSRPAHCSTTISSWPSPPRNPAGSALDRHRALACSLLHCRRRRAGYAHHGRRTRLVGN